jgi:ribosomal protein L3 glutamine methyltransferase
MTQTTIGEAKSHLGTVRDLLRFAVSRFSAAGLHFGHGSTNAYDEAAYLILHTLHLPIDRLEPFLDARLLPSEIEGVQTVLERRVTERIPAAYLTHEAWLGAHRFYVDERVIVPRSFIAELLHEGLEPWVADAQSVESVLDLCSGSGCLAILAALTFPHAQVDAVDLSADALAVAAINVHEYGLTDHVRLVQGDLFGPLPDCRYDLILSNPPYVDAQSMATLPEEYRREPVLALASGEDGLKHIRVILDEARAHLNPGGLLVMEAGHNRDVLEHAFPELRFNWLEVSGGDEFVFLLAREDLPT